MIRCEFYENADCIKIAELPTVPRIGEAVVMGYGKDYRVLRVTDVTWDLDPPGEMHSGPRITVTESLAQRAAP